MQKLHLVGFTTDQRALILSARRGAKSGGYVLEVDDGIASAVAEAAQRAAAAAADQPEATSPLPSRPQSALSVRELQARLRAGRSIEDVAAEAGVEPDWVARFADPVVAEKARVVAAARAATLSRSRLGPSALPIGSAVRRQLVDRGIELTAEELDGAWSARQVDEGRWLVTLQYRSRGRVQSPSWELDVRTGAVRARDRLAGELAFLAAPRSPTTTVAKPARVPATEPTDADRNVARRVAEARKVAAAQLDEAARRASRRHAESTRHGRGGAAEEPPADAATGDGRGAGGTARRRAAGPSVPARGRRATTEANGARRGKGSAKAGTGVAATRARGATRDGAGAAGRGRRATTAARGAPTRATRPARAGAKATTAGTATAKGPATTPWTAAPARGAGRSATTARKAAPARGGGRSSTTTSTTKSTPVRAAAPGTRTARPPGTRGGAPAAVRSAAATSPAGTARGARTAGTASGAAASGSSATAPSAGPGSRTRRAAGPAVRVPTAPRAAAGAARGGRPAAKAAAARARVTSATAPRAPGRTGGPEAAAAPTQKPTRTPTPRHARRDDVAEALAAVRRQAEEQLAVFESQRGGAGARVVRASGDLDGPGRSAPVFKGVVAPAGAAGAGNGATPATAAPRPPLPSARPPRTRPLRAR